MISVRIDSVGGGCRVRVVPFLGICPIHYRVRIRAKQCSGYSRDSGGG